MKRKLEDSVSVLPSELQSSVLKAILTGLSNDSSSEDFLLDDFFSSIYQQSPQVFHVDINDTEICPIFKSVISLGCNGMDGIVSLLENARSFISVSGENINTPLFFHNQMPLHLTDIQSLYNNSPFAAFLDSCSIVINHADLLSPELAALCINLQHSFPHAYVNTYLTPPKASAVLAHADDRDVFVIQILGTKHWKVYGSPVPFPYSDEQVGKNGLQVPKEVLKVKPLIDTALHPGDVLYMPRGFVHEAETGAGDPSFHATVAIATYDWSLSRAISNIMTKHLDSKISFRKAVDPSIGISNRIHTNAIVKLDEMIQEAKNMFDQVITSEAVAAYFREKYNVHNNLVEDKRSNLLRNQYNNNFRQVIHGTTGPSVEIFVGLKSIVRASTLDERASINPPNAGKERGLRVREDTADALLTLLGWMKNDNSRHIKVNELRQIWAQCGYTADVSSICDFTLLSFVKTCIALGVMALVAP